MMRQTHSNTGGLSSPRPHSPMKRSNGDFSGPSSSPSSSSPGPANSSLSGLQSQQSRSAPSAVSLEAWGQGLLGTKQLESVQKLAELVKKAEKSRYQEQHEGGTTTLKEHEESNGNLTPSDNTGADPHPSLSSGKIAFPSTPITSSSALLHWLESVKAADTSPTSSNFGGDPSFSSAVGAHPLALAQMQAAVEQTTSLLTQLEQARINVAELLAGVKSVEETSEELREESEKRGGRSESLLALAQELDLYLSYYNLLPQATSFLSSPSLSLVLTPTFSLTLTQLDIGLSFIRAHPHFRDAGLYRLRFEHCITRGGNLAKMWICGRWRELKEEALGRLREREKNLKGTTNGSGKDASDEANAEVEIEANLKDFASPSVLQIVYSKFIAASPELSSVLCEVQKRCPIPAVSAPAPQTGQLPTDEESLLADYSHSEMREDEAATTADDQRNINTFQEFVTLLNDIRNTYFDARKSMLAPLLAQVLSKFETRALVTPGNSTLRTDVTGASPLLTFISRALVLHRSILLSETSLYNQIFGEQDTITGSSGESALIDFLRTLSKDLIDRLHPRVFAESKVTTLAALSRVVLESCSGGGRSWGEINPSQGPAYLLFSPHDPYDFANVPSHHTALTLAEELTCFIKPLVLPLIKDLQTRLLYRSRAVLSGGDVAGYSPRGTGEELIEVVKKIVRGEGMPDEKRATVVVGRRGKRGRSSLGVGILKAAAERALQESQWGEGGRDDHASKVVVAGQQDGSTSLGTSAPSTLAPPTPGDGSPPEPPPSIDLFKAPPPQVLATWYIPLVRAFTILSLLHPVTSRTNLIKIGDEALEKVRGAVIRGNEILRNEVVAASRKEKKKQEPTGNDEEIANQDQDSPLQAAYEPDELDSAMFDLRNALLLREVSASVNLSRGQPSRYDWLEERIGEPGGRQASTSRGLLDVGAVLKAMAGLFESNTSGGIEGDDESLPASLSTPSAALISSDVNRYSAHLVQLLRSKLPPADGTSHAWLEEVVVTLRFIRRRVALYIDDDEVVADLLRNVVDSVTKVHGRGEGEGENDEESEEGRRIKERLSL